MKSFSKNTFLRFVGAAILFVGLAANAATATEIPDSSASPGLVAGDSGNAQRSSSSSATGGAAGPDRRAEKQITTKE